MANFLPTPALRREVASVCVDLVQTNSRAKNVQKIDDQLSGGGVKRLDPKPFNIALDTKLKIQARSVSLQVQVLSKSLFLIGSCVGVLYSRPALWRAGTRAPGPVCAACLPTQGLLAVAQMVGIWDDNLPLVARLGSGCKSHNYEFLLCVPGGSGSRRARLPGGTPCPPTHPCPQWPARGLFAQRDTGFWCLTGLSTDSTHVQTLFHKSILCLENREP